MNSPFHHLDRVADQNAFSAVCSGSFLRSVAVLALAAMMTSEPGLAQAPAPQTASGQPAAAQPPSGKQGQPRPTSRRSQRVLPFEQVDVASPDGRVKFTLLPNAERLTFKVTMDGKPVIEPSAIRLNLDGFDFGSGVVFEKVERSEIDETYPWHGAHSTAVNKSQAAAISFMHDLAMAPFSLEVRAFNDGVAYRLVVPGGENEARTPDEFSEFVVPDRAIVWCHNLDGHYEAEYKKLAIADVKAGEWAGPPLTFQLPDGAGYGVIAEANLVNYAGMALESDGRRGWIVGLGHRQPLNYPYELRYGREQGKRLGRPAAITGPITTPWRVVIAGRDLNTLVNSDILANLSPPPSPALFPQGINTPWVMPGLAVWRYVDGGDNSFAGLKQFSTWAGQLGAKYHIVEGLWSRWTDEQIKEFVEHSRQHGVGLLFWRHSRQLRTPDAQVEFFTRLRRLGVAGAKIDFIDQEAKEGVDMYEDLLRIAAANERVINFHGANKPTGRQRTWPNDVLREAVRGMESRVPQRARHETILPFTRYLAGPADYTTMHFGERRADSTWAHQIACLATFHSPILTIAAHPETVLKHPAVDVIKSIKPVWDETIVLPDSRIGELSIFARRSGTTWILAVMGSGPAREIKVPLSFLPGGEYAATFVRDDETKPDAVTIEQGRATRGDTLTIRLGSGGGFVGRFVK
jgi:alpha-glucosidase